MTEVGQVHDCNHALYIGAGPVGLAPGNVWPISACMSSRQAFIFESLWAKNIPIETFGQAERERSLKVIVSNDL